MPPKEKRQRIDEAGPSDDPASSGSLFSPELLDTLVSRVADEVTRRLQNIQPRNDDLTEQPAVPATPHEAAVVPTGDPGLSANANSANSVVGTAVSNVSQSITGEVAAVPGNIFHSCSLPIDSRVSEKTRAKIWSHEYIDFGILHSNTCQILINQPSISGTPDLSYQNYQLRSSPNGLETF